MAERKGYRDSRMAADSRMADSRAAADSRTADSRTAAIRTEDSRLMQGNGSNGRATAGRRRSRATAQQGKTGQRRSP